YIKRYDDLGSEWQRVGRTPISDARLPRGIFRWKVEKEGFQPLEYIVANHGIPAAGQRIDLPPNDSGTPMVKIPASIVTLRQQLASYDSAAIPLGAFLIGKFEVTNAEFKRFVDAGGYAKREYWTEKFVKDGRTLSWDEAMTNFRDRTGRPGPSLWEVGT